MHCETCKHFRSYSHPAQTKYIQARGMDSIPFEAPEVVSDKGECLLLVDPKQQELFWLDPASFEIYQEERVDVIVNEKFGCVLHEEKTDANS
jgi:hypothetical protein